MEHIPDGTLFMDPESRILVSASTDPAVWQQRNVKWLQDFFNAYYHLMAQALAEVPEIVKSSHSGNFDMVNYHYYEGGQRLMSAKDMEAYLHHFDARLGKVNAQAISELLQLPAHIQRQLDVVKKEPLGRKPSFRLRQRWTMPLLRPTARAPEGGATWLPTPLPTPPAPPVQVDPPEIAQAKALFTQREAECQEQMPLLMAAARQFVDEDHSALTIQEIEEKKNALRGILHCYHPIFADMLTTALLLKGDWMKRRFKLVCPVTDLHNTLDEYVAKLKVSRAT